MKLLGVLAIAFLAYRYVSSHSAAADVPVGSGTGQKMADFTLADQTGEEKSFYGVAKGKKTLVYYFMGCCNHCVALLPKISGVAKEAEKQGAAVVGVQYYGNTEFCKFAAGQHHLPGTIFADSKGEICGRMGVGEFTTMVLDKNGVILIRVENVDNEDQLRKVLSS